MILVIKANTVCLTTKLSLNSLDMRVLAVKKGFFYFEYNTFLSLDSVVNIITGYNRFQNRILDFAFDCDDDSYDRGKDYFKKLYREANVAAFTTEDTKLLRAQAKRSSKEAKKLTSLICCD